MQFGAEAQSMPASTEPMLSGPTVPQVVTRTLVRVDFRGQFQRIEGRPEEAALALLPIEPDRHERALGAAAARNQALESLLLDNLDLVRETTDAILSRDVDKAQRLSKEMYARFEPEHPRDPLLASMSEQLTDEQSGELRRILDEYWTAWIDWELRNSKDKSDAARAKVQDRLTFALFQDDLRQAYERTIRPYRERLERITQVADPTPEQREAIRGIVIDYIRETRLKPTPEQRSETAKRIYLALDEDRRIKLFQQAVLP
jgi:hypothetical protein